MEFTNSTVDVVIVGGGAAGVNAAIVLARARRSVIVIDAGAPRNAPAAGVHGFLGHEGTPPLQLLAAGRSEAEGYGARFVDGTALTVDRDGAGFEVTSNAAERISARRLLLATGLVDELPAVPGVQQGWGTNVLHCPYCHGWEVRDRSIGIIATSPLYAHQVHLFRQWSDQITLFMHMQDEPTEDEYERLAARGISVVLGEVQSVNYDGDLLTGATLVGGSVHPLDAMVVGPRMRARAELLAGLGVLPVSHPSGMGEFIATDEFGATSAAGVWAAGNTADLSAQVVVAAAAGLKAAAAINADLVQEDLAAALGQYRLARR
ncbi:MAG TPA: NAD(P)/FAD-dependent oxidoreductase [Glaciihabitans sp.]|jgi:thioredoxin reductase|nr:NAD(P)/FAD-dependent oxidoreductase [Glaciihabitans sp.]